MKIHISNVSSMELKLMNINFLNMNHDAVQT